MTTERTALVLSYSDIANDPRVRRQIDWLLADGWTVDTFGLGDSVVDLVREHFRLGDRPAWLTGKLGTAFTHLLLPRRWQFRVLTAHYAPKLLRQRLRSGHYDLTVFNETEFLPWISDRRTFTAAVRRHTRIHVDLHEFHPPRQRRATLGGRLTARTYRWTRAHIGHPAIASRSVVNAPIGRLYEEEFGIPPLAPVRNAPPAVGLGPRPVAPDRVRMLFHGLASARRGFSEILDAMRVLPERFEMTFMLMPNPIVVKNLEQEIADHPARDRISIVPPAPMREIAQRINEFDLEIIFYRPLEPNLLFALPNKFFEAVQARLGVVVGESPAMAEIVRTYGNGVVVDGFEGEDLAAVLAALSSEDIATMKTAADRAARELNSATEGRAFIDCVTEKRDVVA